MSQLRRAVFFDRDGIVNKRIHGDYVKRWEEFEFLSEIFEVLPEVHQSGYLAVVVSNQRGIALGRMTESDLEVIHEKMQHALQQQCGHVFDALYYCPHGNDDNCDCRKPKPGMLTRAADELGIDLEASWLIGDSESDIQAGHAAGTRAVKVDVAMGESDAEAISDSLSGAWMHIESMG